MAAGRRRTARGQAGSATGHRPVATIGARTLEARVRWVLDPDDEAAVLRELQQRHDLDRGQLVCHPRPQGSWHSLIEDLLRALGKHPDALRREHLVRDAARLLTVWLRAEQVRHLVILRAHRLPAALLDGLAALLEDSDVALWLVWHHHTPPPAPYTTIPAADALAALLPRPAPRAQSSEAQVYLRVFQAARDEARQWRPDGRRLGWQVPYWLHAWPGCDVGALLQRLTIDAATPAEVATSLEAARDGFAVEDRLLVLPEPAKVNLDHLGPRFPDEIATRIREIVCPVTAASLVLALATDAEAPFLAHYRPTGEAFPAEATLLAGTYRIPTRVQSALRATAGNRDHSGPCPHLLAPVERQ